jgi:hypothetical protein
MLGHRDELALHQAAGGFFRIRERLFNGGAVIGCQGAENGALVVLFHVLDDGDGIVGIEFSGDVSHLLGRQIVDQILTDIIVHFRNDVGVNEVRQSPHQSPTIIGGRLFDQVGDVGRVERGDKRARAVIVAARSLGLSVGPLPAPVVERIAPESVRQALAWQGPSLVFYNTPLAEVAAQFNRRNPVQIVLADPALAALPVGGSFRPENVESFIRLLESGGFVVVDRTDATRLVLRATK